MEQEGRTNRMFSFIKLCVFSPGEVVMEPGQDDPGGSLVLGAESTSMPPTLP